MNSVFFVALIRNTMAAVTAQRYFGKEKLNALSPLSFLFQCKRFFSRFFTIFACIYANDIPSLLLHASGELSTLLHSPLITLWCAVSCVIRTHELRLQYFRWVKMKKRGKNQRLAHRQTHINAIRMKLLTGIHSAVYAYICTNNDSDVGSIERTQYVLREMNAEITEGPKQTPAALRGWNTRRRGKTYVSSGQRTSSIALSWFCFDLATRVCLCVCKFLLSWNAQA